MVKKFLQGGSPLLENIFLRPVEGDFRGKVVEGQVILLTELSAELHEIGESFLNQVRETLLLYHYLVEGDDFCTLDERSLLFFRA